MVRSAPRYQRGQPAVRQRGGVVPHEPREEVGVVRVPRDRVRRGVGPQPPGHGHGGQQIAGEDERDCQAVPAQPPSGRGRWGGAANEVTTTTDKALVRIEVQTVRMGVPPVSITSVGWK